jgi:hypothetical protein
MYGIDEETIKYLYELVFCNKVEVCMYMLKKNNILYVNDKSINEGTFMYYGDEKVRGMCRYKSKYEKYICHSHPYNFRAYPSLEDIMKVIKHKMLIDVSIISTRWGIWTIVNKNKMINISDVNVDKIREYIDKLGIIENRLGYKDNIYTKDIKSDVREIKDISNKLSKHSLLNIKFVDWNSLLVYEIKCD